MKKKEKIQLTILVLVSSSLLVVAFFPLSAESWSNGWYARSPEVYSRDWGDNIFAFYGTHDFIAEKVYDLTIANWKKGDGSQYCNDRIFSCYMLGTEVPDYTDPKDVALSLILDTHCGSVNVGYQIAGFDSRHDFLIGRDGSPYPGTNKYVNLGGLRNCQIAFERALYHFYRGECEAAAYYMGCMVHLISDVSCFPHVLSILYAPTIYLEDHNLGITLKNVHSTYESQISKLTDHPYWWPPVYFDTNLHGWNHQIMDPSLALEGCAKATFFGDLGHGAEWMYENVARACVWTGSSWRFPALDIRYKPEFYELFRCIERDINTGIFYCAAAVQFIYDECLGPITCDCDQNVKKEGVYKFLYEYEIIRLMHEMSFLVGFTLIGKISAVVAQVLAKEKLEELAIPIIKI